MKKLLFILLISGRAFGQANILQADTILNLPLLSMPISACQSPCNIKYSWYNISGNPVSFALPGSPSTILSGFTAGWTRIGLTVTDNKGRSTSDTLTLVIFPAPVVKVVQLPGIPYAVHDTTTITTPDRKAISFSFMQNGQIQVTYDRGNPSYFNLTKQIIIQ